jgi:hypothetical protein
MGVPGAASLSVQPSEGSPSVLRLVAFSNVGAAIAVSSGPDLSGC